MIKAKVRLHAIETGKPIVVLNQGDIAEIGCHIGDRVFISTPVKTVTAIVDATTSFVNEGEIALFEEVKEGLNVKDGDVVEIKPAGRPKSVDFIKKKLDGQKLSEHEIRSIMQDIVDNNLSDIELSSFVTSVYVNGYDMDEVVAVTNAMVETGDQIDFGPDSVDKHCIGGVAGNRTTMILVPIMGAAGLKCPKTSSRAITSPAGTADTMEVLAGVEFGIGELKEMISKVNCFMVWGGSVNLAPADDKIIKAEYPLSLDPEGQVLASVMAKKKSVDADYLVIDIPVGRSAKIGDMSQASDLARKFIDLGKRLDIATECLITDGSSPVGKGIGPALEARDVLLALEGKGPMDLVNKSLDLAGALFELSGKARAGEGRRLAEGILTSGKAKRKMMEIIEAQGGDPGVKPSDIKIGDCSYEIQSELKGNVKFIDNKLISKVARSAGAPKDKEAGVYLHVRVGELVKKGDTLFTIHSKTEGKLSDAIALAEKNKPITVGGLVLGKVT
jgi:AMP phosphorylase